MSMRVMDPGNPIHLPLIKPVTPRLRMLTRSPKMHLRQTLRLMIIHTPGLPLRRPLPLSLLMHCLCCCWRREMSITFCHHHVVRGGSWRTQAAAAGVFDGVDAEEFEEPVADAAALD